MSDKKQTVDLGLLEEDDEFEEFPAEGKFIIFPYVTIVHPFFTELSHLVTTFSGKTGPDSDSASLASYVNNIEWSKSI